MRAASVLRFHKNRPPQVVLVGLGVYRTRACETGLRVGRKRDRDGAGHSLGDLALQDQHIAEVAIIGCTEFHEAFGPPSRSKWPSIAVHLSVALSGEPVRAFGPANRLLPSRSSAPGIPTYAMILTKGRFL